MKTPFKLGIFIIFVAVVVYMCREWDDSTLGVRTRELKIGNHQTLQVNSYEASVYEGSRGGGGDLFSNESYIGNPVLVDELYRILDTWNSGKTHDAVYAPPTGVLLYGPPGTGKTTLARQACKESGAHFLIVTPDVLENRYQGESFKLMRAVFTLARKLEPCVLFFDEIDGIMSKRSELDQAHTNTMKTLFLSGMDSVKNHRVLVIGATNRPEALDTALMRRLEVHFETGYPSDAELKRYLKTHMGQEFPEFVESLTYKITLHKLMTFMKFCVRRQNEWTDQDLITLYQEYSTIYSFL